MEIRARAGVSSGGSGQRVVPGGDSAGQESHPRPPDVPLSCSLYRFNGETHPPDNGIIFWLRRASFTPRGLGSEGAKEFPRAMGAPRSPMGRTTVFVAARTTIAAFALFSLLVISRAWVADSQDAVDAASRPALERCVNENGT